ncbi:LacI family DNA-binding transcriptional regulator [Rhizobium sp. FY34]|uniref:LacI family DNA-binding transcriptional regulator n=1 Tax=Rhizobium sp. FY34 TaxID=2562309 RepID=UPI0010C02E35|nr:LacI family DNA-binding transcriptional regulator [Rhizobium sp. FY34]
MKPEKPKLALLAGALGVSVATVSNALSGKGRVSPELAERIRAKADMLGYVPSVAGRALRTGRSGVIGLVLPDIGNPLFPQIAQAIEQAASMRGYGVLIGDSRGEVDGQTQAIARLIDRGVDGMVVIPRRGTRVSDIGCPVAVIDSPSTPGNTVSADHWDGGRQMGAHLASLGHRRVLLVGTSPLSNVQADRIGGLKEGLGDGSITETVWIEKLEANLGPGCPLGLVARVAQGFTAIATLSDLTALRALTELQVAGIAVPAAASVTGFDDLVWASVVTPGITTMRLNATEVAQLAVTALTQAIEAIPRGELSPLGTVMAARECVPMQLVIRQSSGPAVQPSDQGQPS